MGGHVAVLYGIQSSHQVNGYIFAAAVPNYSKIDINSTPLSFEFALLKSFFF